MADKPNKPQKLKARLPRGLADRGPAEIAATRHMVEAIRVVFERYGFEPVETPAIEYTDALGKFLPDQDRPNEGVFSFQDDDEQWLSLRYDLTAPLARYVAENFQNLALPYRSYRFGWVFRNEKPGPGRFRQFMQFDADTVGAASMAADAEMCMLAADTMEALGIPRGSYVVKVNNRKVLDGAMDRVHIPAEKRLTTMRAIDKLDRLGIDGVKMLLGKGRKDESGDFTKGAELLDSQIAGIVAAITGTSGHAGDAGTPGEEELSEIAKLVRAAGYDDRVRIDKTVVRGLDIFICGRRNLKLFGFLRTAGVNRHLFLVFPPFYMVQTMVNFDSLKPMTERRPAFEAAQAGQHDRDDRAPCDRQRGRHDHVQRPRSAGIQAVPSRSPYRAPLIAWRMGHGPSRMPGSRCARSRADRHR